MKLDISRSYLLDAAAVLVLGAIAALGFQPLYGGIVFLLPALGGLLVGTLAAAAGRLLRVPLITTLAFGLGGYFLFGSALAMPADALFGVLPTLTTLSGLVRGAVFGWSDAVTLSIPLQAPAYIGVVAYVACWAAALIGGMVVAHWAPRAGRDSVARRAVAAAAPLALLITTIVLGTHQIFLGGVRGVLFTGIALVWVCWRQTAGSASVAPSGAVAAAVSRRRLIGTGVVALGALVVGGLVGGLVQPASAARFVVRDEIVPPFDPLDYPSPLAGFRKYVNDDEKTVLFTEDGLPKGASIRLATMDTWDGVVWNVASDHNTATGSGAFRLLGRDIPEPSGFAAGTTSHVTFTIKDYTGVWLPGGSYPTKLVFPAADRDGVAQDVRVDSETGTIAVTTGVTSGLSYEMDVTAPKTPSKAALAAAPPAAGVALPDRQNVPDVVTSTANQWTAGQTTAYGKLQAIAKGLQNGYLSHGRASDAVPARAGEGADRVVDLLSQEPMNGDQEQYTTAFALMAGQLGYPTRVVLGAEVPADGGPVDITGADVTAWDEVALDGVGWVRFDPTPVNTNAPKDQTVKPQIVPQPQVRQPPRDHLKDDQLLTPVLTQDQHKKKQQHHEAGFHVPVWAYWAAGSLLLLAAIVFLPLLIVLLLKRRRRAKRMSGPGDRSAAGAWAELRSTLAELGVAVPAGVATRKQLVARYTAAGASAGVAVPAASLAPLAQQVDHAVFSADELGPEHTAALWAAVDGITGQARSGLSWIKRRLADYRYSRS